MGNINVGRWVGGGVVAAVILFVVDFVLNGMILANQWAAAMTALGKPAMGESAGEIVVFVIYDLVLGLAALWIYVGIRPRFGAGVTTAVYAGLATWVLGVCAAQPVHADPRLVPGLSGLDYDHRRRGPGSRWQPSPVPLSTRKLLSPAIGPQLYRGRARSRPLPVLEFSAW